MKTIILAAVLGIACLAGCGKKAQPVAEAEPQLIKTMVISGSSTQGTNVYPGRVTAGDEANLMFMNAGSVQDILVKEGQTVTKGTVLAKLDPRDFQNRADEAKAHYELMRVNLNRFSILLKSATVSRAEYDQKAADYKVAEANLDTAQKALEDTNIKAPYDGIIAKRFVEQFEHVQAKQPIMLIQNLDSVEVLVNIPEEDLGSERKAMTTQTANGKRLLIDAVSFATVPGKKFDAYIKEFATRADPKTQTYQVRLIVNNVKESRILPGMSVQVRVKFEGKKRSNLTVPIDAVSIDAKGKYFVWLIDDKNNTAHKKPVDVGMITGGNIIITGGLDKGQRIAIAGVSAIQEGMRVKILSDKKEE
ncbi:MAG: efflux RND transporter periplasmic adaptor subunit [Pseudomonadota bacterium]|nr:efflux RND transporter periplasmic adaptor subunit [Pseudomonadota bacterium]